jgi:hypothetical protein
MLQHPAKSEIACCRRGTECSSGAPRRPSRCSGRDCRCDVAPRTTPGRPPAVPAPTPNTSDARRPAQSHNAHSLETVTVYYRWHPLFGLALPVRRRQKDRNGERLLCQSPDDRLVSLPSWMCSQECLQFLLGPPLISVEALTELRVLLDVWQTSSGCLSRKEETDETIGHATSAADESVASRRTNYNRRSQRPTEGTGSGAGGTARQRSAGKPRKVGKRRGQ